MKFILTGGEESDYKQALALLEGKRACFVLADRGYDADYIVQAVEQMGAIAVIPPRKNRRDQRPYDAHLYHTVREVGFFLSFLCSLHRHSYLA